MNFAATLNNIRLLYYKTGDYNKAVEHYKQAKQMGILDDDIAVIYFSNISINYPLIFMLTKSKNKAYEINKNDFSKICLKHWLKLTVLRIFLQNQKYSQKMKLMRITLKSFSQWDSSRI